MGADYFAPGEVAPISQKAYITKAPVGYYEVGGSLGFNVNAPDFTPVALVSWVQTNMPVLSAWLNNVSGGDWGAHKMGTLKTAFLGNPSYPYQFAPMGNLTAAQVAYNNGVIQAQLAIYNSKIGALPDFSKKIFIQAGGEQAPYVYILTNYIALANATGLYALAQLGYSLNPADGFLYGFAAEWLHEASPDAYAALGAQINAIAAQEVSAANAASAASFTGFLKFAGAIVATVVTAGVGAPALVAALKSAGSYVTATSNLPGIAGTATGQALATAGASLNPTPLQQFKIWATNNPGDAEIIYALLGLLVIFIVYKIAKR